VRGTSRPTRLVRKPMDPSDSATSYGRGRRHYCSVARVLGHVSARVVLVAVIVVVAIAVVVDACGPPASFDGVPGVAVWPEMTIDCRSPSSGSAPVASLPPGRWVLAVRRGHSSPVVRRPLARREALCLFAVAASRRALSCCHTCLSSEVAASRQSRSSMAAVAKFCGARLKSGGC
jgi:hypothetical protein